MTKREKAWLLPPAAACFAAGILIGRTSRTVWLGIAACVFCLAGCFLLRDRARFAACMALMLAAGCVCGFIGYHPVLPDEGGYRVGGIVSDEVRTGANGQVKTSLTAVTLNGKPYRSGAYWTFYADAVPEGLAPGRQVSFSASLYHPQGASNPDGYDFREELLRKDIAVGVYGAGGLTVGAPERFSLRGFTASLRGYLSARLTKALGDEAGGYAAAMLLGRRDLVASEDRDAFARLGIAHVLSVSGFHVGVLVGILALFFRLLRVPQKRRILLYAVILGFYCFLCGLNRPVIRASLLILITLYGKVLNRPRDGLHLLSAVFIVMLAVSPVQLTGLSFLLSFGAMLGLILIAPWLNSLLRVRRKVPRALWQAFCYALSAQIGILLPELYFFQELPLLGLLVNIPVSFIATAMITLYWVLFALLPLPFLSGWLAVPAKALTSLLVSAVRALGSVPGVTLWTRASDLLTAAGVALLFAGMCCLLRLRPRRRAVLIAAAAALIGVSLLPLPHTGTEYIQFSVGSADAGLLWDRDKVIAVDTGNGDGVLSGYLHRRRLTPDAVIVTHLHADHALGLRDLMDSGIPVPLVYLPEGAETQRIHPDVRAVLERLRASGTRFETLAAGDVLTLPSGTASVLWPEHGRVRPGGDANNYPLVLRLELNGVTLLQTGDLTGAYEMYATAPADILKIAHHGSPSSTSEAFLERVGPQTALLSCDREARAEDVRARCPGIRVFDTAAEGCLTVRFLPGAYSVEPFIKRTEN